MSQRETAELRARIERLETLLASHYHDAQTGIAFDNRNEVYELLIRPVAVPKLRRAKLSEIESFGPVQERDMSEGTRGDSDVERFRVHLRMFDDGRDAGYAELPDSALQDAIDGAKGWICGRRWSWTIVAANYLRDGRFHA